MSFVSNFIKPAVAKGVQFVAAHSSTALTGIAVAGVVTTVIFTIKATPKAKKIVEKHQKDLETIENEWKVEPEQKKEAKREVYIHLVKEMAPVAAPVVIAGGITIAAILGTHAIDVRKQAGLMAACNVAESQLQEHMKKTEEVVGKDKADEIRKGVVQDRANAEDNSQHIEHTGQGEDLWYDAWSDRWFYTNRESIREAANNCNGNMTSGYDVSISLSEFYRELGLKGTKAGEQIGWGVGTHCNMIDLNLANTIICPFNGKPAGVLDFLVPPRAGFDRRW